MLTHAKRKIALEVLEALGPRGLGLTVTDGISSAQEAAEFVQAVDRACGVGKPPGRKGK